MKMPYVAHQVAVLLVGCFSFALVYYYRYAPSVLYHDLAEALGVSEDKISIFGAMYFWTYALSQPICGIMSDILSPRLLIAVATFTSTMGSVTIAASNNYALSCVARLVVGIGCGPIFVAANRLLADWYTPQTYGVVSSFIFSVGLSGGMLAQGPLLSLSSVIGWRWGFNIGAIIGVIIAFISTFVICDTPAEAGFDSNGGESVAESAQEARGLKHLPKNLKRVLTQSQFWILCLWGFMSPSAFMNLSSMWAGPYLRDVIKMSGSSASYAMLMMPLSWVIGSPTLMSLNEVFKTRKWIIVVCNVVGLTTAVGFLFVDDTTNTVLVLAMMFVFAAGSSSCLVVANAMFKEMNIFAVATGMGCANTFPFLATAILQSVSPMFLNWAENDTSLEIGHSIHAYKYGLWMPTVIMLSISLVAALCATDTFAMGRAGHQPLLEDGDGYTK